MSYPNPLQLPFTASLAVFYIFVSTFAEAQSKRKNKSQSNYLILVIYSENLPETVYITIFPGTDAFRDNGTGTIDTQNLRQFKNPGNLALWVFGKTNNHLLLTQGGEPLAAAKDADQYPGWGDE